VLKRTSDTGWSIKGSLVVTEGPVVGKLVLHVDYIIITFVVQQSRYQSNQLAHHKLLKKELYST